MGETGDQREKTGGGKKTMEIGDYILAAIVILIFILFIYTTIYLYVERQKNNDNKAREMKRFRETSTRKDGTIDMKLVQFKEYCSEKRVKTGGFISAELDLKYEKEALEFCFIFKEILILYLFIKFNIFVDLLYY